MYDMLVDGDHISNAFIIFVSQLASASTRACSQDGKLIATYTCIIDNVTNSMKCRRKVLQVSESARARLILCADDVVVVRTTFRKAVVPLAVTHLPANVPTTGA